jgi:hypothetical protein
LGGSLTTTIIPERFHPVIRKLLELKGAQLEELATEVVAMPVCPSPEATVDIWVASTAFGAETVRALGEMGVSLLAPLFRGSHDPQLILEGFHNSVRDLGNVDDMVAASITSLVATMVSSPAFSVHIKAWDLRLEVDKIAQDTRVISDIRPVFPTEHLEGRDLAIIVHTLRLKVGTLHSQEELSCGVTREQLRSLRDAIDRAIEKEAILERKLRESGWVVLKGDQP